MTDQAPIDGHLENAAASTEVNPAVITAAYGNLPGTFTQQAFDYIAARSPNANIRDYTDPANVAQAAALHLSSSNGVIASSLGRAPSAPEQYIGLKVGPVLAPDVISAPADTPLSRVLPSSVLAAHADEFDAISTAGEFRARAALRMGEDSYQDPNPAAQSLNVVNAIQPGATYSNSGTASAQPFSNIVVHTSSPEGYSAFLGKSDPNDEGALDRYTQAMLKSTQQYDPARGGVFGYHYVIGRDGTIYQTAPEDARTNHIKPGSASQRYPQMRGLDLSNSNSIGITTIGDTPNAKQTAAATQLAQKLQAKYGIASSNIYGHGELQSDREGIEGTGIAQSLRAQPGPQKAPGWLDVSTAQDWNNREASAGLPKNYLATQANIESSGNPHLQDPGNPNAGLHQFEPGDMKQWLGHDADPLDAEASTQAAINEAVSNQKTLQLVLGRDPTGGDLYMLHQQGTSGGKALLTHPDEPAWKAVRPFYGSDEEAKRKIASNIPAGSPLKGMDIDQLTAKQFTDFWGSKFGGNQAGLISNNGVNGSTLTPASPVLADDRLIQQQAERAKGYDTFAATADSLKYESSTAALLGLMSIKKADPNYIVTTKTLEADPRLTNVPLALQWPLLDARSPEDYEARFAAMQARQQYMENVDRLGGWGTAARLVGAAADPVGWLAGAVSPFSTAAAKAGQAGRILRMAATGADFALGNSIASVPEALSDPGYSRDQALYTAAGGFLFGSAVGAFGRIHPHLAGDMQALEDAQHAGMAAIDQKAAQPGAYTGVPSANPASSSVGAAATDGYREPLRADSSDWLDPSVADAYSGKAARPLGLPRMDLSGQLKGSENPMVAALGGALVEDGVGNADHSAVMRAATVEAKMLQDRFDTELGAGYQAAFKDWSTRNDVSWFGRRQKEREFRENVADYVDNPDRTVADQADPAVKQFGATLQDFWSTYHDLGQNPGALDGSVRAAIPGLANIPKNELYFPHMWDWDAFGEADRKFGTGQMKQLLTNAVKDSLPELLPAAQKEIDEAAAAYEAAQGKLTKATEGLSKADEAVSRRQAQLDKATTELKDGETLHERYQARLDAATEKRGRAAERHEKASKAAEDARGEHERLQTEAPAIHRDDVAERVGNALYNGIRNVQAGQEVHLSNLLSGQDLDGLRGFLGKNSNLSSREIEAVIQHLTPNSDKAEGPISRLKHRTTLNVHHEEMMRDPKTGELVPISVKSLMNRDSLQVASMYNRQLSNRVALSRLQIENPRFDPALHEGTDVPRYLVDGIRNEADWERITNQVKGVADEMNQDPKTLQKDLDRLNFVYNTMTGQLQRQDKGTLGSMLRLLRKYNFSRALGQVGFAHVAQTWSVVAQMGLKAAMANMPTLRDFIRDAKTGHLVDQFAREIEYIADAGTDTLRGLSHLSVDDFGQVVGQDGYKKLEDLANRANRYTMAISGMAPLLAYQQKWAAKAALARFVFDAEGKMPLNMRRMAALGITEDDRALIAKNILEHRGSITTESGQDIPVLNIDKWDPEARHAISYAVNRWSRRIAQENDLGQMNMMLGSEMGKLMWQFRMFMFGAYAKQTLHNLHMRDFESASMVLGTTALGALAYAAQTYLQSIGRTDREQFLEDRLSVHKLALAGIQRSPTSSVVPMGADMLSYAAGFDPIFDARASGTPAQGILSNPTFSLLDQGVRAMHGVTKLATGQGSWTQQDQRAFVGTLPFSNFLPVVWTSNAMMQGMPAKDPPKPK